jgi:transcriptional/translational regulatory protein YebC/TACO1
MFDRLGRISYPSGALSEDAVMEAAIDAGAADVELEDDEHVVFTAFEDLAQVAEAMEAALGPARTTAVVWKAKTAMPLTEDGEAGLERLIDALEDEDDVQNVWTNVA